MTLLVAVLLAGGFEGAWEGEIEIPGAPLDVRVVLREEGGAWTGAIDIPAQGAHGLALEGVRVDGDSVEMAIAGVPGAPTFRGTLEGGVLRGTFTQGGARLPFSLRPAAARARPQTPQPPFPYRAEEVAYTRGDVTFAGTLTVPDGEGPHPAVLLLSGSDPQDRDGTVFGHQPFLVLADALSRAGVAVLRVDDRGVGGTTGGTGKQATTRDPLRADDALAGVAFLRARDEIDGSRVGLLGHSEGGLVAPLAASKSEGAVAFVVMIAGPAVPGHEVLLAQSEALGRAAGAADAMLAEQRRLQDELFRLVREDGDDAAVRRKLLELVKLQGGTEEHARPWLEELAAPWFRAFLEHDPRPVLEGLDVPVLALYGGRDLQVPAKQSAPAARAALAKNPRAEVRVLDGLNHLLQPAKTGGIDEYAEIETTIDEAALEAIVSWVRRTAAARR